MRKYKVHIVQISLYNSQANGKIERTQRSYLEAIWKVLQGNTSQWPGLLGYALWADRITVKRNTGYSPYYLLYGQHHIPCSQLDEGNYNGGTLSYAHGTIGSKKHLTALHLR